MKLTNHAIDRISNRLASLISLQEAMQVIENTTPPSGSEVWVVLKTLDRAVSVQDGDRRVNGDTIVGVLRNGNVTTVMLTRAGQVAKRVHC